MNAPFDHASLAITNSQIEDIVNRAIALRASPSRGSYAWCALLCAIDVVLGNDDLRATISDLESDLGPTETECLACGQDRCGCDQAYDDYALTYVERIAPGRVAA